MTRQWRQIVALLSLVMTTSACSGGGPTSPTPTQPGPPVVVVPPTNQETVVESRAFILSPCTASVCYNGAAKTLPALGPGKLKILVTVTEPQAKVVVRLWSESTQTNLSPRLIASREITTTQDPSDPTLRNGSKGEAEFHEYDGEIRWIVISNATPIELPGGWVITHVR